MRPKSDISVKLTRDQKPTTFKYVDLVCFRSHYWMNGVASAEELWLTLVEAIENEIDPKVVYSNDMQHLHTYLYFRKDEETYCVYRLNLHDFHHDFLFGCSYYNFVQEKQKNQLAERGFLSGKG